MSKNKLKAITKLFISCLFMTQTFASSSVKMNSTTSSLHLVVTLPYLQDLVENVSCHDSSILVHSLIPVNLDPHTYVLTPEDRLLLKNAGAVIEIGSGLEHWLNKVSLQQPTLILTKDLQDPHIWHSPELTKQSVDKIAKFLASVQPDKAAKIEKCELKYLSQLKKTVSEINIKLSQIPAQNRVLFTNHDSLGYFAQSFGFQIHSILGLSDEDEPSAQELVSLISKLKKQKVKAIFLESTGTSRNIQTLSSNAHVQIGGKLYGDSLGEKGSGAETTLDMWNTNAQTIWEALHDN